MTVSIAVIVVNWKVRDLLRECLVSLKLNSGWEWGTYQVFVVDNASGDGSAEMIRSEFSDVTLVVNDINVGFGAANNQAFAMSTAEVVVLLNPDTIVLPGSLRQMVESLKSESRVAIVGCRLLNKNMTLQRWTAGSFPHLSNVASHYLFLDRLLPRFLRPPPLYLDDDLSSPTDVGWVSGACMAVNRDAIGNQLFDQSFFMYAEDMELCYRVVRQGWRVRYDPRMSIVHYQGASLVQQSADIMMSSLKGPRDFFMRTHGAVQILMFDLVTTAGFGLRWLLYSGASLVKPVDYRSRAESSYRYLCLAISVMRLPRTRKEL